jgi:hypothetical protein
LADVGGESFADHGGRDVVGVCVEDATESTVAIAVAGGALDQLDADLGRADQLFEAMARPSASSLSPRP